MSFGAVTLTLLKAFSVNIEIFAITLVLSLPLGLVAAFGSMSRFKPLSWLTRGLVYIIRGTPLMLQIMIIYY
ncbi:MAG: ABC transporter permease subunit, partial [Pseudoflavonifractor sp.]